MKTIMKSIRYKLALLPVMLLSAAYSFAQDSAAGNNTTQTSVSHSSSSYSTNAPDATAMWYTAPWVWAVGALVLILILYAIFRGGDKDRTEVTRTVKTTTEVKND